MANIQPTKTTFLIAEDVRPELNGKMTLIGFIAPNELQVDKNTQFPTAFPSICIVLVVHDGEGTFTVNASLTDPNGTDVLVGAPSQPLEKKAGASTTMIFKVAPMIISKPGDFNFSVKLDGQLLGGPYGFTVKLAP